ncbi:MAG: hypothetical protein F6J86_16865 [Symploca sp. SIO1B1]|nr:hypothetical protein [Symploca sp. SIO1B1]
MIFDANYSSFVTILAYPEDDFYTQERVAFRAVPRPGDLVTCIVEDVTKYFEVLFVEHSSRFNPEREAYEADGLCIHALPISSKERSSKLGGNR